MSTRSVITGTGSFIPTHVVKNREFLHNEFYTQHHDHIKKPTDQVLAKFREITGIQERRYANLNMKTSDLAFHAAEEAILSAGIDKEELDYIILAHNFGNVAHSTNNHDLLPNLAAQVKHKLEINNPACVAYDLLFGCPGWIHGVIQAHAYLQAGMAKKILVVGADILSRVVDVHDIDSMLFGDGAGAAVVEAVESDEEIGILSHGTVSDCTKEVNYLKMGHSNCRESDNGQLHMKMQGRNVFKYGLEKVPVAMAECLKKSGFDVGDVDKFIMHQANLKMIRAMVQKLFKLFGKDEFSDYVLPTTVEFLGNTSVATNITLYDLILKKNLQGHFIKKGDLLVFASVGAGMHANCVVYRQN